MLFDAAQALTDTPADGPGTGVMKSVDDQRVASSNTLPQALAPPKATKEDKVKATKDRNNWMAKEICQQVEKMMDTEVKDEEAKEINMQNAVIVGAAVTVINGILQRNPALDITILYGTENLIYQLPGRSGTAAERKVLRGLYDIIYVAYEIVYVAALEEYPDLLKLDKAALALRQRCCHTIYQSEKAKMANAAEMEKRAEARGAKKAEEQQQLEAFLDSLTPDQKDEYDKKKAAEQVAAKAKKAATDARSKAKAAEKRLEQKAQEEAAAQAKKEEVGAGIRMFANFMSTNTLPCTPDGAGSYKILINAEEIQTLHSLFEEAVSARLSIDEMVGGFAHLVPNIDHHNTIPHFKGILLNACQRMCTDKKEEEEKAFLAGMTPEQRDEYDKKKAADACKGTAAVPHDFFNVCVAFFLVRLVGHGRNDTCHSAKAGGDRVPAVSEDDFARFMKMSQEDMDQWAKDMKDPALMRIELGKTPLHAEMKTIFDKFSEFMVQPVMSKQIVEAWNKNSDMFRGEVLLQSVVRSYGLQKAKGKRMHGTADVLSGYGVFKQEERDVETSHNKMKRAKTAWERPPKKADETKVQELKRKYDDAVVEHDKAVEILAKKKCTGLKDFVEGNKGGPK